MGWPTLVGCPGASQLGSPVINRIVGSIELSLKLACHINPRQACANDNDLTVWSLAFLHDPGAFPTEF